MYRKIVKRMLDITISFISIFAISPVLIVSAIIIKKELGSPVLFRQKRPGYLENPIYIMKFRTMTNETDENGDLLPNEERITKLGSMMRKLSIDELPQLFNVLKGDISLVGPRPLLMDYLELYSSRQAKRHNVKPGITGLAQVNGRNGISWEEKFEYDLKYVQNQSFILDIKILIKTFVKVFKSENVSPEDRAFVERFDGNN
ncbi:sugar transferase EpsL [Salisediminibacterium halotolerans]|uniref:Sugar transferase EpsL n=2 Tax=Salisediminibacterium halotolerans TaxID=517425 RepID=A0A1H9QJN4_9BACI|nr:sugar transferase EpsL [Salisediminibacterium haloalkalitolerans]